MNRKILFAGLAAVLALVGILFFGLGKDPRAIRSPLVGKPAPTFALRAVGSDQVLSLESLKGKPAVINFWATWCGPCAEENPVLVATAQSRPDVQFVGVVFQDEEAKILSFLRQNGQGYPTVMDDGGKTAIAYGVGGVPETFFIDRTGKIAAKFEGPISPELLASHIAEITR